MLLLGDIVIEVTGPRLSPAKVLVVTDVAIDDECGGTCGGEGAAAAVYAAAAICWCGNEMADGLNNSGGGLTTIRRDTASSKTSCTKIYCSKVWIRKLR